MNSRRFIRSPGRLSRAAYLGRSVIVEKPDHWDGRLLRTRRQRPRRRCSAEQCDELASM